MSAHSRMARRFSFLLSPGGIVIGYVLALLAATAGAASFSFSNILMGLLFVVVGSFFVAAVPIILMAYMFMVIAFCRAVIGLGHRLTLHWWVAAKPCPSKKTVEPQRTAAGLWDRWIDGSW